MKRLKPVVPRNFLFDQHCFSSATSLRAKSACKVPKDDASPSSDVNESKAESSEVVTKSSPLTLFVLKWVRTKCWGCTWVHSFLDMLSNKTLPSYTVTCFNRKGLKEGLDIFWIWGHDSIFILTYFASWSYQCAWRNVQKYHKAQWCRGKCISVVLGSFIEKKHQFFFAGQRYAMLGLDNPFRVGKQPNVRPSSRTTSRNSTSKVVFLNMKTMSMLHKTGAGSIKDQASRCGAYEIASQDFVKVFCSFQFGSQSLCCRSGKMPWISQKPVALMSMSNASFTILRSLVSSISQKWVKKWWKSLCWPQIAYL